MLLNANTDIKAVKMMMICVIVNTMLTNLYHF